MRDLGLTIPGDLSLIAHDDVFPWLKPENFSVPLSTTRSSIRLAGARVAERLAARISGLEEGARGEVWPVDLVVRGSVRRRAGLGIKIQQSRLAAHPSSMLPFLCDGRRRDRRISRNYVS